LDGGETGAPIEDRFVMSCHGNRDVPFLSSKISK
jgi:hypothetical protein